MHLLDQSRALMRRPIRFGRSLPPKPHFDPRPDWRQAELSWIRRALAESQALPAGGWFVLDASRRLGEKPRRMEVAGKELVVWRASGKLQAAPNACPHMGASLAEGRVEDGCLVCPWHALRLGEGCDSDAGFRPLRTHDDGVLGWVQLPSAGETLSDAPYLPARPRTFFDGVIRMEAACEPRDVVQNRLDPWHGAHFHPHSFVDLRVLERLEDEITVRVSYRVAGPFVMRVDARFHTPSARCIVMTIVEGDGRDSVVETHATPLGEGRTAIIEATLATSDRPGFAQALWLAPLMRPLIEKRAARLWVEDAAYAERLYALRNARARGENVPVVQLRSA